MADLKQDRFIRCLGGHFGKALMVMSSQGIGDTLPEPLHQGGCPLEREGTMKNKIALLCLGLASAGFALDEYMPLNKGVLELDAGINPVFPDAGGMVTNVPLQVKYGIMDGLDVELGWAFASANDDAGGGSGFGQPALALKYKIPDLDLAAYVNLTLPFATGDNDVDSLNMGITPGVLYQMVSGPVTTILGASYQINLEADDVKRGNILSLMAKPSYAVTEYVGAYLGLTYTMTGETELAGTGQGNDVSGFTLWPGFTAALTKELAYEVNLPVVFVDGSMDSWGIWASVYYTLGL
jgi:hypothetical protein